MLPDPGEELFSSLLEEERTPPDVFSDITVPLELVEPGVMEPVVVPLEA